MMLCFGKFDIGLAGYFFEGWFALKVSGVGAVHENESIRGVCVCVCTFSRLDVLMRLFCNTRLSVEL